jgi:hypothetical protein
MCGIFNTSRSVTNPWHPEFKIHLLNLPVPKDERALPGNLQNRKFIPPPPPPPLNVVSLTTLPTISLSVVCSASEQTHGFHRNVGVGR